MVIKITLCKRCKKNEAAEGKKNCSACAEYMRNYMKQMRAKKKVKKKEPMVLNENPEYSFDVSEDSGTIFDEKHVYDSEKKTLINVNKIDVNKIDVNKKDVNKNYNKLMKKYNFPLIEEVLEINKMTPEDFRYFYFRITGKVFRENKNRCIEELIKILGNEL